MAHSLQAPLPSTSTAKNPGQLFNPQLMHTSPPAATLQAMMANSIFTPNAFNPAAFPQLAAFGSASDFSRVQQWFQQQQQNSIYGGSPIPSNAPSLNGNLSSLSLFTNDSTLTRNSQSQSQIGGIKSSYKGEGLDMHKQKDCIKFLLSIIPDDSMIMEAQTLKTLKMFVEVLVNKQLQMDDANGFQELIKAIICRLASSSPQFPSELLDILALTSTSTHYQAVVREQPTKILSIFANLVQRAAANPNIKQAVSLLRIFYNSLAEFKDKSEARKEPVFLSLITFLRLSHTNAQYFTLGILRVLMHAEDHWKKFFINHRGMEEILKMISQNKHRRFVRQAIQTLNTLVDSRNTQFASKFVELGGIAIIVSKVDLFPDLGHEDLFPALLCLKLVSDIPTLARIEAKDISRAIHLALRGTLPQKGASTSKAHLELFWKNIANALGFLRNAITLNESGRDYLAGLDQGKSIPHLICLATQSFDLTLPPDLSINPSLKKPKIEMDAKRQQILGQILEQCLAVLALVNKETANGEISQHNGMASKMLAEDGTAMFLYQLVLRFNNRTEALQRSVLMSLKRILNAGIPLPLESRELRMAETLLHFMFTPNPSPSQLPLMKISAEVLTRLVSDKALGRFHLGVLTPLLKNDQTFQPFNLLNSITNNTDLYLSILKLVKELCQREPSLKAVWFSNGGNDDNFLLIKYLRTTSSNPEIVSLCTKLFDILQMQMGEDTSESTFYDIFTQGIEMDQSDMS